MKKRETMEIDVKEVKEMVKAIKKTRRQTAKIMRGYRHKKFGKPVNEFGQSYSENYLYGIIQAFEFSLMALGYTRKEITIKKNLDFIIDNLEKQGIEA